MGERIPISIPVEESAPIACTLGADDVPERRDLLGRLRASLVGSERTPRGLLLRFPAEPDVEADVRRLAADEKRCCEFWGFEVRVDDDHVTLRWDGPPATTGILDVLAAFFDGDVSADALSGLI